jgi:hypothetical protein
MIKIFTIKISVILFLKIIVSISTRQYVLIMIVYTIHSRGLHRTFFDRTKIRTFFDRTKIRTFFDRTKIRTFLLLNIF